MDDAEESAAKHDALPWEDITRCSTCTTAASSEWSQARRSQEPSPYVVNMNAGDESAAKHDALPCEDITRCSTCTTAASSEWSQARRSQEPSPCPLDLHHEKILQAGYSTENEMDLDSLGSDMDIQHDDFNDDSSLKSKFSSLPAGQNLEKSTVFGMVFFPTCESCPTHENTEHFPPTGTTTGIGMEVNEAKHRAATTSRSDEDCRPDKYLNTASALVNNLINCSSPHIDRQDNGRVETPMAFPTSPPISPLPSPIPDEAREETPKAFIKHLFRQDNGGVETPMAFHSSPPPLPLYLPSPIWDEVSVTTTCTTPPNIDSPEDVALVLDYLQEVNWDEVSVTTTCTTPPSIGSPQDFALVLDNLREVNRCDTSEEAGAYDKFTERKLIEDFAGMMHNYSGLEYTVKSRKSEVEVPCVSSTTEIEFNYLKGDHPLRAAITSFCYQIDFNIEEEAFHWKSRSSLVGKDGVAKWRGIVTVFLINPLASTINWFEKVRKYDMLSNNNRNSIRFFVGTAIKLAIESGFKLTAHIESDACSILMKLYQENAVIRDLADSQELGVVCRIVSLALDLTKLRQELLSIPTNNEDALIRDVDRIFKALQRMFPSSNTSLGRFPWSLELNTFALRKRIPYIDQLDLTYDIRPPAIVRRKYRCIPVHTMFRMSIENLQKELKRGLMHLRGHLLSTTTQDQRNFHPCELEPISHGEDYILLEMYYKKR